MEQSQQSIVAVVGFQQVLSSSMTTTPNSSQNSPPSHPDLTVQNWVDARGLLCPQPVLRATLALKKAPDGTIIGLISTDPHTELDLEVFCLRSGHELVHRQQQGEEWYFWLQAASERQ